MIRTNAHLRHVIKIRHLNRHPAVGGIAIAKAAKVAITPAPCVARVENGTCLLAACTDLADIA